MGFEGLGCCTLTRAMHRRHDKDDAKCDTPEASCPAQENWG